MSRDWKIFKNKVLFYAYLCVVIYTVWQPSEGRLEMDILLGLLCVTRMISHAVALGKMSREEDKDF